MSRLGDLIVEHGPFEPGEAGLWMTDHDYPGLGTDAVNALRDELVELRRVAAICMCGCGPDEHLQVNTTQCCSCDCQAYTPRGDQGGTDSETHPSEAGEAR